MQLQLYCHRLSGELPRPGVGPGGVVRVQRCGFAQQHRDIGSSNLAGEPQKWWPDPMAGEFAYLRSLQQLVIWLGMAGNGWVYGWVYGW